MSHRLTEQQLEDLHLRLLAEIGWKHPKNKPKLRRAILPIEGPAFCLHQSGLAIRLWSQADADH